MFCYPCDVRRLSAEQIASFRIDGFLAVENVVSAADIARLADHADLVASGRASHVPGDRIQLERPFREGTRPVMDQVLSVRKLSAIAYRDEVFWRHACHAAIVDRVADLLGTDDIKLYNDQLFMKGPRTGSEQPWHQDSASWRDIFPMDLVTAWTAVDEATSENGCLNFAAGTHRWGMVRGARLEPFVEQLGTDPWPVVQVPLRPGDVSFHHSLVLHRSGANRTGTRRRGYAVHYMRAGSWRDESVVDAPTVPPFRQVRGRSFPGRV